MQKLTKEQRDYVLNLIENKSIDLFLSAEKGREGVYINYYDMENILDKCTEKEFPADFCIQNNIGHSINLCVAGDPVQIGINISYEANEWHTVSLDAEDFKSFVIGCRSILEWIIDEQS